MWEKLRPAGPAETYQSGMIASLIIQSINAADHRTDAIGGAAIAPNDGDKKKCMSSLSLARTRSLSPVLSLSRCESDSRKKPEH